MDTDAIELNIKQEFGAKENARKPEHRRSVVWLGGLGEIAVDHVDHLCDFGMYFIAIGGHLRSILSMPAAA
jgi:hypothetical protein